MHDRRSAGDCELHDLAGASAATRGKAVPDRDQRFAMGDRCAACHDISIDEPLAVPR